MLIVPEKRLAVLRVKDPQRILTVIPTAKPFKAGGKDFIAVPHKLDESRVLRNIGVAVPAPIRYYYDWPIMAPYKPFDSQRTAAAFLTMHRRAFNLSGMGSGKSLTALWAYDYLRSIGQARRMLVIAPLSTLERTWADEVFKHFPHLTASVLYGTAATRRKLLKQEVDVYIVNHDGLGILLNDLMPRTDIDLVVIDELAQAARNASTDKWKELNALINPRASEPRAAWGLTGTPTPNEPTDAWAQCRLLVPNNVPPYRGRFRDMVMRQAGPFRWIPRDNATEIVHAAMQPAIRFSREECVDLPPLTYESREVEMTPAQAKAYKEMLTTMSIEADEGRITAVNEGVKMFKLLQIACGVVYSGEAETTIKLDAMPRIRAVNEVIAGAEGKVIVFAPFVSTVELLLDEIGKHHSVEMIHGGVSKGERDRIFSAFQNDAAPRVIVAQPAAMSHGLTLTKASVIVWYAPITSNDVYEQANARIHRPGQKMNTFIVRFEGTAVERKLYARLETKQKLQGLLLEEVRANRGKVAA